MPEMPGPIPDVPCQGCDETGCWCGLTEKALRAGVALTPEQREWCLNEIGSVEGYKRSDHEAEDDKQLGRSVLSAWVDYCRDKGLM
jgi:hypothetical protein